MLIEYLTNSYLTFIIGAIMLYYGAEYLISNCVLLAEKFQISPLIVGITIIAIGTSLPELIVSLKASYANKGELVLGNILGSNIANISLVLGSIILFYPIKISNTNKSFLSLAFFSFTSILFYYFISTPNLSFVNGVILFLVFVLYIILSTMYISDDKQNDVIVCQDSMKIYFYVLIGIIMLSVGSEFFIDGALGIATIWGIKNVAIGLTIVALGTSIPELFVSFSAAKKKEYDFVFGNVLGSNIINIALVAGLASMVNPLNFNISNILFNKYIFIVLTFVVLIVYNNHKILNRIIGINFIVIYLIFLYINFLHK